ncbi:thioredoxin domain-containing protein [Pseudotenacibaculum sp. MALMAid0570]|uniref:thioredoxin domain-containing protein n=1 Tax=Pseudotenacibaculum sp. MALMAid0570 TaxID=3143938 RepID=UPI0032DE8366
MTTQIRLILILLLAIYGCKNSKNTHKYTNNLIKETSPYLLQHAHNPVNWYPWGEEALNLAKKEKKLILISVGYASCHWCHVMEKESFENEEVAKIMNENFINIKVDREEHPNVDKLYINAVQLMTGNSGWPLNCIALPDGSPIWGGTYFEKEEWIKNIQQVVKVYEEEPEKIIEYSKKVKQNLQPPQLIISNNKKIKYTDEYLNENIETWKPFFDTQFGGTKGEVKFPKPNTQHFLLRYSYQKDDNSLKEYVHTTLNKIALGGIYDHISGGFSRYTIDSKWHIPHFEKMLYDNGQLVSLYSDAFLATKNELYKEVVYETLSFVEREMMSENGGFYSSLNADSKNNEGHEEEGAYYVWEKQELEKILKEDFQLFSSYYNINSYGYWEKEKYHLIRNETKNEFAKKNEISITQLNSKLNSWKEKLTKAREKRERPKLDDKILTSWNAIMLSGYIDAYRVFENSHFLDIAIKNATFIKNNLIDAEGKLYRSYKEGKLKIEGYLEDYGTLIKAYINLYQVTFDEQWLLLAKKLTDFTLSNFYDSKTKLFFYNAKDSQILVTKNIELEDNVIPSSNSIMAKNLFLLGHFFGNKEYLEKSEQMLSKVHSQITEHPYLYANWLDLYLNLRGPFYEVAILGAESKKRRAEIDKEYKPNKLFSGTTQKSDIFLLKDREVDGETIIYVCESNTCKLPTSKSHVALSLLKNK